jgi:hypothetical protein
MFTRKLLLLTVLSAITTAANLAQPDKPGRIAASNPCSLAPNGGGCKSFIRSSHD